MQDDETEQKHTDAVPLLGLHRHLALIYSGVADLKPEIHTTNLHTHFDVSSHFLPKTDKTNSTDIGRFFILKLWKKFVRARIVATRSVAPTKGVRSF